MISSKTAKAMKEKPLAPAFRCSVCRNQTAQWVGRCMNCGALMALVELAATDAASLWKRRQAEAKRLAMLPSGFDPFGTGGAGGAAGGMMVDENGAPIPPGMVGDDGSYGGPPREPVFPKKLSDIDDEPLVRLPSGDPNLDRVLGGGWVAGKTYALYGPPGAGKSRIALATSTYMCRLGRVTYATAGGEEGAADVKRNAVSRGYHKWEGVDKRFRVLPEANDTDSIAEHIERRGTVFNVLDSLSMVASTSVPGKPGDREQVRYAGALLRGIIKESPGSLVAIVHERKDGAMAGAHVIAYLFDAVILFERVRWNREKTEIAILGDQEAPTAFVRLRSTGKNRFGSPTEQAFYRHTEKGLVHATVEEIARETGGVEEDRDDAGSAKKKRKTAEDDPTRPIRRPKKPR